MKSIDAIREKIGESGRDIRLNLETVLTEAGAPGLTPAQIRGVALACTYSVQNRELASALLSDLSISREEDIAAQGAATLMAMNNVYYRTLHLAEDPELSKLPAKLRMNFLAKPGIPKVDFELMCLAVSALAGCGKCITSHILETKKSGINTEGIQSAIRIASVVRATQQALFFV